MGGGLIYQVHLCVYPLTRGTGPRLFEPDAPPTKWLLINSESYANGVLYLGYRFEPSTAAATSPASLSGESHGW